MKIANYSENIKIPTEPSGLKELLEKIESASFADECRYKLTNFGRRFCCIFITDDKYSKECCWHVKHLPELLNDISILENKSKEIDYAR